MNLPLTPSSVDVLLFDLGRVVLDINFDSVMATWAGHAGCTPADLASRFVVNDSFKHHETGRIDDAATGRRAVALLLQRVVPRALTAGARGTRPPTSPPPGEIQGSRAGR